MLAWYTHLVAVSFFLEQQYGCHDVMCICSILKWQTAREEYDRTARDLEYIIIIIAIERTMIRGIRHGSSVPLGKRNRFCRKLVDDVF